MRTRSIHPGDIVFCNKSGHLFYAKVIGAGARGTLTVAPIERNIRYRQVTACEIADHWTHTVATRREDRAPQEQTTLHLPPSDA
jgi:hypothetical protein